MVRESDAVMLATIPGEVVASGWSALVAAVAALAVALSRTRERIAKLEEWQRLRDRAYGEERE